MAFMLAPDHFGDHKKLKNETLFNMRAGSNILRLRSAGFENLRF